MTTLKWLSPPNNPIITYAESALRIVQANHATFWVRHYPLNIDPAERWHVTLVQSLGERDLDQRFLGYFPSIDAGKAAAEAFEAIITEITGELRAIIGSDTAAASITRHVVDRYLTDAATKHYSSHWGKVPDSPPEALAERVPDEHKNTAGSLTFALVAASRAVRGPAHPEVGLPMAYAAEAILLALRQYHAVLWTVVGGDATIGAYADQIMTAVDDDISAGAVPASVRNFTDLHDHLDANGYLEAAGVPYDGTQATTDVIATVQAEVNRRLSAPGRPFCTHGNCRYIRHDHTTNIGQDGEELTEAIPLLCSSCAQPAHYDEMIADYQHDDPDALDCFLIRNARRASDVNR